MEALQLEGQGELFPSATEKDIKRTKFLLGKYVSMVSIMHDYELHAKDLAQAAVDGESARRIDGDEYYANKTANAVILTEKQRWVYEKYREVTAHVRRAHGLIIDFEERQVVEYRYLEGHSYTETVLAFEKQGMPEATVKRRLNDGIEAIAGSLKLWGALEEWRF